MSQKSVISYDSDLSSSGKGRSPATYYLATNTDCMQFYCFEEPREGHDNSWSLINQLDRSALLGAGDKATAKTWAKWLGLKSWTYVRV